MDRCWVRELSRGFSCISEAEPWAMHIREEQSCCRAGNPKFHDEENPVIGCKELAFLQLKNRSSIQGLGPERRKKGHYAWSSFEQVQQDAS